MWRSFPVQMVFGPTQQPSGCVTSEERSCWGLLAAAFINSICGWTCSKPVTCKMFQVEFFCVAVKSKLHLVGRFSFSGLTYSVKHLASTGGLYHRLVEDLFKNSLRQNENCMKWFICCYKEVCLLLKLSQHHNNCDCTSTDERLFAKVMHTQG